MRSEPVSMAREMLEADLAVTSAGRSVYEAATVGTPVVVLAANAREATHAHLGYDSGVVFLGIGSLVDDAHIVATIKRLLADAALRRELSDRLRRRWTIAARRGSATAFGRCWPGCERRQSPRLGRGAGRGTRVAARGRLQGGRGGRRQPQQLDRARDRDVPARNRRPERGRSSSSSTRRTRSAVPDSPKYWSDEIGTDSQYEAFRALRPSRLRRLRGGRGGLPRARHRLLRHPVRPPSGRGPGEDRRPPLQDRQWRHHRPPAAGGGRDDGQAVAALDRRGDARGDPAARSSGPVSAPSGWCRWFAR